MSQKPREPKIVDKSLEKDKPKVAKVVALRNRFFFMLYRYSSIVFLTSLLAMCFSIGFLFFFARQPVPPQYIPVSEDGAYIKPIPLSVCKEDREVHKFVMEMIPKLYKFDYINYADQLQTATGYFIPSGWNDYLDQLKKSGLLTAIKENRQISSVDIDSIPIITQNKIENNVCAWELKVPLTLLRIGQNSQTLKGDLYIKVIRNSVINNPDGLGILRLVFLERKI